MVNTQRVAEVFNECCEIGFEEFLKEDNMHKFVSFNEVYTFWGENYEGARYVY